MFERLLIALKLKKPVPAPVPVKRSPDFTRTKTFGQVSPRRTPTPPSRSADTGADVSGGFMTGMAQNDSYADRHTSHREPEPFVGGGGETGGAGASGSWEPSSSPSYDSGGGGSSGGDGGGGGGGGD